MHRSVAPADERRRQMGDPDLTPRERHLQERIEPLHPKAGAIGFGSALLDGKPTHLQMRRGNDDKVKGIERLRRNAEAERAIHLGLRSETEADLPFGQRKDAAKMIKILPPIPGVRPGDPSIPEMIGDADLLQAETRGIGEHGFRRLRRIARTPREAGMNVKVVIDGKSHAFSVSESSRSMVLTSSKALAV